MRLTKEEKELKFKADLRAKVLMAIDEFVKEKIGMNEAGWHQEELPALFKGIDAHAEALTKRLAVIMRNNSEEDLVDLLIK